VQVTFALEFEYTFEEYLEASKAHVRRGRLATVAWYFFAIMFTLAASFTLVQAIWHERTNLSQYGALLIPAFVVFVTSPFFFRLMARQRWKQQRQATINYEITPDVISVKTKTSTAEMTWGTFNRFVETKNVFLLYPNKLVFHIVPKRAFASPHELASFRELATSKIPPSKRGCLPWQ
jgi:hypothetical protein